jgi:hypothetical protein
MGADPHRTSSIFVRRMHMSYRSDLDALAARHAALESEVDERTRERDRAADLLRDARARARLPVLDNLRVAAPCRADWSKMSGDDRVRACGDCQKNVYNLSELTRDEAEALILAHEGKLCVRYYQRADGTILTKDCAIGVRRRRRRRIVAAGMVAAVAGSIFGYEASTRTGAPVDHHEVMMGDIGPSPPVMMGAIAAPPPNVK